MDLVDFARSNVEFITEKNLTTDFQKKITIVLRGDGLWEIRKNNIATFFVHKYKSVIPGFSDESYSEGCILHLPKIPKAILDQVVSFFRYLSGKYRIEAYLQIFWNPSTMMYYVTCPQQIATQARVKYDQDPSIPDDHILVCEIHSHNTMPAFFSKQDDEDELSRGNRFFGVIGGLRDQEYGFTLSFVSNGSRVFIPEAELFEQHNFPDTWLSRIEIIAAPDEETEDEQYIQFDPLNSDSIMDNSERFSFDEADDIVYGEADAE